MPIRCVCPNGHALRVKDKLAGGTGTCPTCQAEFSIPATPAPTPLAAPPSPSAVDESAVEWRLAWPDGQQFGPTVATVFTQWIAAGRVPPDALVWRTGWDEWQRASEAGPDLPAPLPDPDSEATRPVTAPGVTLPPPLPSAAAEPSPPTIDKEKTAGGAYALRRRREARRRRLFTIGLAVVCLALTAMLVGLMFSGPPEGAPVIPR